MTTEQIEAAVHTAYGHYKAQTVKRGRNPAFPYVPIYRFADSNGNAQTTQIKGKAFANRDDAIAYAQRYINALKRTMRDHLQEPRYRALREEFGLPREI